MMALHKPASSCPLGPAARVAFLPLVLCLALSPLSGTTTAPQWDPSPTHYTSIRYFRLATYLLDSTCLDLAPPPASLSSALTLSYLLLAFPVSFHRA
ncbi:hypothetical protein F4803DRAFT_6037 [Xylaria telfairii]|nr:hypothetical protein F4803DRAFT_6037 [Xylaria telfairii]